MKEKLKKALRPIYQRMLDNTEINQWSEIKDGETQEYACMAALVGDMFPKNENEGIIYYGRANNGWNSGVKNDFDYIFDKGFLNEEGENGYFKYITDNRSQFCRVAGKSFSQYYGDEWYNHVAYSNLYKVSRCNSNPSDWECGIQEEYVTEIFKTEIDTLSPKFVVMFTGKCWADCFLYYANGNNMPLLLESREWGKYKIDVYKIGEVYYLVSEHPQGKKESLHVEAVLSILEKYK